MPDPNIALPHFAAPFGWSNRGANVVEQDTPEEIATCLLNIASCVKGSSEYLPDLGVPDLSFKTAPVDTQALVAAAAAQEPRARITADESGSPVDGSLRTIALNAAVQRGPL